MTRTDGTPWWIELVTPDRDKAIAPMQLPGLGVSVVVADPSGMGHCAWQAAPFAGTVIADAHGDPVWHEAYATDFAATHAFLREVFGWDSSMAGDTDEFRYAVNAPEEASATTGLMDAPGWGPDFTASWSAYIKVDDMDACLTAARELGGSITQGPDETPYGLLATLTDPNGQQIKVIVPPSA